MERPDELLTSSCDCNHRALISRHASLEPDWRAWNEDEIHRGSYGADFGMGRERTACTRRIVKYCQANRCTENTRLLSERTPRTRPPHLCESGSLEDAVWRTESMLREAGSCETRVAGVESEISARAGKHAGSDERDTFWQSHRRCRSFLRRTVALSLPAQRRSAHLSSRTTRRILPRQQIRTFARARARTTKFTYPGD